MCLSAALGRLQNVSILQLFQPVERTGSWPKELSTWKSDALGREGLGLGSQSCGQETVASASAPWGCLARGYESADSQLAAVLFWYLTADLERPTVCDFHVLLYWVVVVLDQDLVESLGSLTPWEKEMTKGALDTSIPISQVEFCLSSFFREPVC